MKNQKGITLLTLSITILIMMILTVTIAVNIDPYINQKRKANFETDMQRLKEEISQYYARVKDIPIINKYTNTTMLEGTKNVNDNDEYYVIDIKKLEVELNYGADYYTISKKDETEEITDLFDVYIINKETHTIYYPKGIKYNGMVHYRLIEVYSEIEEKITVTYYIDTDDIKTQGFLYGENVINPTEFTPTKEGWTFIGWKEDKNANADVLIEKIMEGRPITLYAVYQKDIQLSYNGNGETEGTTEAQTAKRYFSASGNYTNPIFTISECGFFKTGYDFNGWNIDQTATEGSAICAPGIEYEVNADVTLYAVWKKKTYAITYDANGGSGAPVEQTKTHGENLTLSSTQPSRAGYTFLGWSESSSATSATYSAGGIYSTDKNVTLYAVWQRLGFTYTTASVSCNNGTATTGSYSFDTNGYSSIQCVLHCEWSGDREGSGYAWTNLDSTPEYDIIVNSAYGSHNTKTYSISPNSGTVTVTWQAGGYATVWMEITAE